MASDTVALIGMMGAGKSTVGIALAAKLGRSFLDSDAVIEDEAGMSVAEIFRTKGESAFRDWEARVLGNALRSAGNPVIGVAGGAILRDESYALLDQLATVVWLEAPIDTLIARVIHRHLDRPLIETSPEETMRKLYQAREPKYRALADIIVASSGSTPDVIADEIIERLK